MNVSGKNRWKIGTTWKSFGNGLFSTIDRSRPRVSIIGFISELWNVDFFCLFENRRRKKTRLERKQQLDLFLSRTCLARNRCRCRWCFCLGCCCWRWRCCWCCHCCSSQTHVWCCQNNRGSLVMTQNFSIKSCSNVRALLVCTNRWKYWKFASNIKNAINPVWLR